MSGLGKPRKDKRVDDAACMLLKDPELTLPRAMRVGGESEGSLDSLVGLRRQGRGGNGEGSLNFPTRPPQQDWWGISIAPSVGIRPHACAFNRRSRLT
jgi:hypothetical protein